MKNKSKGSKKRGMKRDSESINKIDMIFALTFLMMGIILSGIMIHFYVVGNIIYYYDLLPQGQEELGMDLSGSELVGGDVCINGQMLGYRWFDILLFYEILECEKEGGFSMWIEKRRNR